MTHLSPDEFVDAADGIIDASRQHHLDSCERCRGELESLIETLRTAAEAPLPEPSPLFWDHFSARVRAAIATEPGPTSWWGWLRWPALVLLAGLAVLAIAVVASPFGHKEVPIGQRADDGQVEDLATTSDSHTDAEWRALADLVGPLDWDTAVEAGLLGELGAADAAMLNLSPDEQRELSRLVAAEPALPES